MRRVVSKILIITVIMLSIPVIAFAASESGRVIKIDYIDYNGDTYAFAVFDTDASAAAGTTTFGTHGWNLSFGSYKFLYETPYNPNLSIHYVIPLVDGSGSSATSIQSRIRSQKGESSAIYQAFMTLMEAGGTITFNAHIQRYDNTVATGQFADTLSQALALANWGPNTQSDFENEYYNREADVAPQPVAVTYSIDEKHIETGVGTVLDHMSKDDITESSYTTQAQDFSGYDFVGSRAGYTWDAIANGNTQAISSRTAIFNATQKTAYHYYYYKKVTSPPVIPETGNITIFYRDKATNVDLYPPDTSRHGIGYGSYTISALADPQGYTFDSSMTPSPQIVTLNESNRSVEVIFLYRSNTPTPPPPPAAYPPSAILDAPDEVMAGTVVKADGGDSWSNNPGGHIEDYDFDYDGANLISDNGSYVRIWYPETGTFRIDLIATDERGETDSVDHEITVTPPIPTAVIEVTGNKKENRKVTLKSSGSYSPPYYPIDPTLTVWNITAISGGTAADIRYTGFLTGTADKDVLFKKAGTYRVRVTVINTYGLSASTEQIITIAPDLPPVAKMYLPTPDGVPYVAYRDPSDANLATFEFFNESSSPDGDTIDKAVGLYCYDSDNDGDYTDEQWYYSNDGTTWASTGMNYANTVSSFNIYSISTSSPSKFTLRTNQVGSFHFAIRVMETIQAADTIASFISESDYKRDDDF